MKFTNMCNRMTFNNRSNPCGIDSYNRLRNDKCKTIQTRKLTGVIYVQNHERKTNMIYYIHIPMTVLILYKTMEILVINTIHSIYLPLSGYLCTY